MKTLTQLVLQLRKNKRNKLKELAKVAGVCVLTIQRWEKSSPKRVDLVAYQKLQKLADKQAAQDAAEKPAKKKARASA